MAQIWALILAIPKIISLIESLERSFGKDWQKVVQEGLEAYGSLRKAESQEDRNAALKRISDAWTK